MYRNSKLRKKLLVLFSRPCNRTTRFHRKEKVAMAASCW